MPPHLQFPCVRILVFMFQPEILDLNTGFIFYSPPQGRCGRVQTCFHMHWDVREIKEEAEFSYQSKTNYNCAFQQTSDCRLIFSYETETEVNEANCVYQHFQKKKEEKKPTQFWREFSVKNKLEKIATVVSAFPKAAQCHSQEMNILEHKLAVQKIKSLDSEAFLIQRALLHDIIAESWSQWGDVAVASPRFWPIVQGE